MRKASKQNRPSGRLKILFADDEQSLQELMSLELPRMGHEVTVCPDGDTAVAALERNTYDCLLVDLDMDWVITWPSGWGVSDKIPRMHIFDVLRPKNGRGVACTQTTWDGAALDRVDP